MLAEDLLVKVKEYAKKMTPDDRLKLLKKAHILDDNGIYDARFFSEETVKADIERGKIKGNVLN